MNKPSSHIKVFFVIGFALILNLLSLSNSFGQCANISGQASGVSPGVGCSPHIVNFTTDYDLLNLSAVDIAYEVDWGDGTTDVYVLGTDFEISTSIVNPATTKISLSANHTFTSGTMCRYEISANLRFDGNSCAERQVQPVVVWDNDNVNGGDVFMTPDEYEVCAGSEVTVNFTDATDFNCTPPDYIDSNPNFFARTYAFEYGTTNNIADIEVDGAVRMYPYYDGVVFNTLDGDLVNDGQVTYDIFVPATATVGQQFEVTLYYWNFCNPFNGNPAAPNFGDAQIATSLITIVPPPEPEPEVFDANENFATNSGNNAFWYDNTQPTQTFCADQIIHFRQNPVAAAGTDYEWDFDWDGTGAGFTSMSTNPNASYSYDALTYTGQTVLVGLRISRGDVGTPCVFYESIEIEIEAGPQADFDLDIDKDCEEITVTTTNNSIDEDGYQWTITQSSGPAGTIEDISAQENNENLIDVTITGPGIYEVELVATSTTATSCPNSTTKTITIYDQPVAEFTAADVCLGDDVVFTDLSDIPTVVDGDYIDTWEFVFDFPEPDFTTDPEGTFDSQTITTLAAGDFNGSGEYDHTYAAAGTYNVALRVSSNKGSCVSDVYTATVEVKEKPNALFDFDAAYQTVNGYDYSQPLCPGTPIAFINNSPSGQTDPAVDRYYIRVEPEDASVASFIIPPNPLDFWIEGNTRIINPLDPSSLMPNPLSNANYSYDFYFIAVGDNNCETEIGPLSITLLPATAAGFDIFEGDPSTADPYDNLAIYCSPYEFHFQTNATTQTFNADEYIWTVTDGLGNTIDNQTILATDPNPEQYKFNFQNVYPSISQEVFTINLQVITNNYCVTDRNETVRLFPKPSAEFDVLSSTSSCDTISYTFKAVHENISYFWSVTQSDNSKLRSVSQDNSNATFTVSYDRPTSTEPDLDFTVELYSENLVLCQSDTETKDITIPKAEVVTVDIDFVPNSSQDCMPSNYTLGNTTTSAIPAGTEWEFEIYKFNTATTDYDLIELIKGTDQPPGNEDFATGIPYEFTAEGDYKIDLVASLVSNCRIGLSTPVEISIYESPIPNFRTTLDSGCSPLTVSIIENSYMLSGDNFDLSVEVYNPISGIAVQNIGPRNGPGGQFNTETLNPLVNTSTDPYIDYEITLTATAANALNCSNDSTYIVRVFQEPQIDFDITSVNPACEEDYTFDFDFTTAVFPTGTEFTWNWDDGQSLVTDQDTVVSHTFVNRAAFFGQDNYNVRLTAETPNGCNITVSKLVELHPQISASFFMDKTQGCAPLNVNFTSTSIGTGLTGNHVYEKRVKGSAAWQPFVTAPSPIGTVAEVFDNATGADLIYEIRYMVSSAVGGCSATAAIQEITIFPEFTSPAITGADEVCAFSQSVEYSVPFTAGSTYLWKLPLGAYISNQNADGNVIEVNFSNFTGDVELQEINANGCFGAPSTKTVTVLSGPSATLSLNGPNVICPGGSTSLKFTLSGPGSQGYDVIYNNGQTNDTLKNISNGHVKTVSPTNSTNYFLIGVIDREYPSCNPLALSGSAFVNVNNQPTATISGTTTICEGNTANLIINLTGIGPWDIVYTDGTNNYTVNTSNPVTIQQVNPLTNTNYELVSVTDNNTPVCTGTVSGIAEITVNKKPTAKIVGNVDDVCQNDLTQIGVELTGTGPWTVRYTDGTITYTIGNITPDPSYNPATDTYTHLFDVNPVSGTTNYVLTEVRDSSVPISCAGDISGTATVIAYDRPEVSLSGDATLCEGESTALKFEFTGDGPFQGSYTENGDTVAFNNLPNTASINVSPSGNTIYRVVELFDNRGCNGLNMGTAVSVNVNPLPTSTISASDTTCFGKETNLIFDQTGVGPWTITYSDGNQNHSFVTAFNRHFEPVSPTSTTNYSLVSVTDSNSPNSCTGTVSGSAQKYVYPKLDASFTVDPQHMILPESTIKLTNNTTNKGSWDYLWEFGDGTTSTDSDPAPHDYGIYGDFTVRLTVTNGQCTDTYQTLVTIGAIPPIIDFTADPQAGCLPLVVQFENLSRYANPSTYQWEFGDGQRASAVENPIHVYTNPGVYNVTLSATNITGQRTELIKEELITVYATPQASFTIPDEYRQVFTTEEVRFVNLSQGADEFIWKFGDGNESFEKEPIHAYPDSGIYDITLIAINTDTGCTDSMSLSSQVKVILGGESKVPNAFTPSRAGPGTGSTNPLKNDFFLPKVEGTSQFNMKIYNRWGELLFESVDKTKGWDGYYKGELMPQGVYVYRLELVFENGRRETKVGDITLIR